MSETISCDDLVARTQRWLKGMHGVPLNRISGDVTIDQEEITLVEAPGVLVAGSYLGVGDEIVYVWEVQPGAKRLVVARAQLGTSAYTHADKTVVESNSRYPRAAIKDALQEEIRAWPDQVYAVRQKTFMLGAGQSTFDAGLTDSRIKTALAVDRQPQSGTGRWTSCQFRLDRLMPRDVYPSGTAVTLYTRPARTACRVRLLYGEPFDLGEMADADDVVEDWGLSISMYDIPPAGAAARLIQQHESLRTDTNAFQESRVASEVPATYQTQLATSLRLWCSRRLGEEALRLRSRYSIK